MMNEPAAQIPDFRVFSVLRQSFSILFRNIVSFGLISLFIISPTNIYLYVSGPNSVSEYSYLLNIIELILSFLLTAVLVFGIFQGLRGRPVSILQSLSRGMWAMFPVLGVVIVMGLIWAVLGLLIWGAATGFGGFGGGLGVALPLIVIILFLYLSCVLWVVVPAAVVEGRVFSSLRRSAFLTKGYRWRVLGIVLLVGLFAGIVQQIAASIGAAVGSHSSLILISWAATAFTTALGAAVITVGYYRLCLVKDGVEKNNIAAVFD